MSSRRSVASNSTETRSTEDRSSVEACVNAIASAYEDATEHLERIKAGRNENEAETTPDSYMNLFEDSLLLGPVIVRGQYSEGHQAFNSAFAAGDKAALETLKDTLLNIQITILANLHKAVLEKTELDYIALLATSDTTRVDTIVCLAELGERMGRPLCLRRARTVSSSALPLRLMPSPPEKPPAASASPPEIPPMSPSMSLSTSARTGHSFKTVTTPSTVDLVPPPLSPSEPSSRDHRGSKRSQGAPLINKLKPLPPPPEQDGSGSKPSAKGRRLSFTSLVKPGRR